MANGPFAFSVLILKNALVLHDLPNIASCFIHLSPCSLAWTLRWFAPEINEQWPGIFNLPVYDENSPPTETFTDIFYPGAIFYFSWFFFFIIFSFFVARHHGLPHSKRDTVFVEHMRKQPALAKKLGYDGSTS